MYFINKFQEWATLKLKISLNVTVHVSIENTTRRLNQNLIIFQHWLSYSPLLETFTFEEKSFSWSSIDSFRWKNWGFMDERSNTYPGFLYGGNISSILFLLILTLRIHSNSKKRHTWKKFCKNLQPWQQIMVQTYTLATQLMTFPS